MVGAVPARLCLLIPLVLALGCDSLSEYRGSFQGSITSGSFVRSCFQDTTRATLRFDPAHVVGSLDGVPVSERSWLTLQVPGKDDLPDEVVFDAPLEPISLLSNDTLADFDFPGPKRLRSFMLVARPEAGALAGRDALVVISLLADKRIELRVIARGEASDKTCPGENSTLADDAPATPRIREYYGFWRLK